MGCAQAINRQNDNKGNQLHYFSLELKNSQKLEEEKSLKAQKQLEEEKAQKKREEQKAFADKESKFKNFNFQGYAIYKRKNCCFVS